MPTRPQIDALIAEGRSFEEVGRELGIAPGLAYMIATGSPADGSEDAPATRHAAQPQLLVNPRTHNPTRNEQVLAWVRGRAARELRASEAP